MQLLTYISKANVLSSDSSSSPSICPKNTNNPYLNLLTEFPALTQVCSLDNHIDTTGPPVSARPRRLALERLCVAKQEFEHMLQLGIIRPSSLQCLVLPTTHGTQKDCRKLVSMWGLSCPEPDYRSRPLATLFPTSTTFRLPCKVPPYSRKWTWCVHTTKFQ